jgi:hypothetical protein
MTQPVWILSVDLQTKTATFSSGMADAAKSARGAFTEIKGGAEGMAKETGANMFEARHGVMLLGEEFGIHLPRALTSFIASIGPIGAAMEAAFPFLAIAVGATLLIEALVKVHEEGEKLTTDQIKFGTAVENAFNSLDDKILQAQIRADELRNDHLGALSKQLELIDKQSMAELVHSFGEVAKAADTVFADLKSHWYTFGIGAVGAKHAMDEFQTQYDSLLAQGKDSEASSLLAGTKRDAERVLALQKQARDNSGTMTSGPKDGADVSLAMQAQLELKKSGASYTEKEIAAQEALVEALKAQAEIEGKVAELKKQDSANTTRTAAGAIASQQAAAARTAAENMLRMGEASLTGERAQTQARLDIQRASIAERLQNDLAFADRENQMQLAANQQQIAALDKLAKDYPNQLKALHDKAFELTAQHEAKVAEITAKSQIAQNTKELTDLEQGIRERMAATDKGSTEQLAVVDAAIKEEQGKHLEDTAFYRELLKSRVEIVRQAAEEESKLKAEAGKEAAENTQKMGELALAHDREQQALADSARRMTEQRRIAEAIDTADKEHKLKMDAFAQEAATLDKSGKDYENKLKALQDKQKQLIQQHENEVAAIKDKAAMDSNARILSSYQHLEDSIAGGLTSTIMRHQSFAAMMGGIGDQIAAGMIKNAIMSILANDMTKPSDAAKAARQGWLAGMWFPPPLNIAMAPALAAIGFASVMAFEGGTDRVPGIGRGDVVPAMLTPGEGIVPGGVMDGLSRMARSGDMGSGGPRYVIHAPIHMSASVMDADGVDKVFTQHSDKIQKHFENTLRKMNR